MAVYRITPHECQLIFVYCTSLCKLWVVCTSVYVAIVAYAKPHRRIGGLSRCLQCYEEERM